MAAEAISKLEMHEHVLNDVQGALYTGRPTEDTFMTEDMDDMACYRVLYTRYVDRIIRTVTIMDGGDPRHYEMYCLV